MFAPLCRVLALLCAAMFTAATSYAADAPKTATGAAPAPKAAPAPAPAVKPEPKTEAKPEPKLVNEADAAMAALTAAGCGGSGDCAAKGKFDTGAGKWVFVVTYAPGKGDDGRPMIVGAGAMRVTLDPYGGLLERVGVAQP